MTFGTVVRVIAAFGLAGCSALVDPDTRKLEPQPVACQAGDVASCQCDGGNWSTQHCNAGGSYDPCVCGTPITSGGTGGTNGDGRGRGRNNAPLGQAGTPAR